MKQVSNSKDNELFSITSYTMQLQENQIEANAEHPPQDTCAYRAQMRQAPRVQECSRGELVRRDAPLPIVQCFLVKHHSLRIAKKLVKGSELF